MSADQATFSVSIMARVLGVSKASFYAWLRRRVSVHAQADAVLLKRRRDRVKPFPQDLARTLTALLSEPGLCHHQPEPVFVGARNERLTRSGAIHIVRHAAAQAVSVRPSLEGKPISPHIFRH